MRRLQPDANICVCGPDVRWCGNESGAVRPSEWSVVPAALADCERIKEQSQHSDNESFRQRKIQSSDLDLGSREKLEAAGELIWYPAEINTSIRPGWFYHEAEDNEVKTAEELQEDVWLSQRIESFEILASVDGTLTKLYEGTTVGYKKIARFGITETDEVIVRITDSRLEPVLSHIGLY